MSLLYDLCLLLKEWYIIVSIESILCPRQQTAKNCHNKLLMFFSFTLLVNLALLYTISKYLKASLFLK